jgi:RNA polymerase sigma-70 factor (ECF subfamily)
MWPAIAHKSDRILVINSPVANISCMTAAKAHPDPGSKDRGIFATTHWTLVQAAGRRSSPDSARALATLCETYWYPLYAFVRRRGHEPAEAQDLTQEFFAGLLEKNHLRAADPDRGRFRSFLLTAFRHFLSNKRAWAHAQKRGGDRKRLSLDFQAGEERYAIEPSHGLTAERLYERRWALTLLEQALASVQAEYDRTGKANLLNKLRGFLLGEKSVVTYAQVATEVGLSEGAVKVAVHRLRQRFREALRREIAHTVAGPEEVEEEIRQLFAALSTK